jgi:hypothetical protein
LYPILLAMFNVAFASALTFLPFLLQAYNPLWIL